MNVFSSLPISIKYLQTTGIKTATEGVGVGHHIIIAEMQLDVIHYFAMIIVSSNGN